ncbi:unnamed protein product [Adineta ricciae]|uniref:EF-hand domain-containing protein n=1 Tax=Adineta ricciae TaxID=249248 RepID=A0A815ZU15_ADIRI|nr:unnamed protein product [Adineta ricciae]CAF1588642.1 unnamed protein product [Adineta ricciae]
MATTDAAFNQADANHDGTLSRDEFKDFLVRNSVSGSTTTNYPVSTDYSDIDTTGGYGSTVYRSSVYGTSTGGTSGDAAGLGLDLGYTGSNYGAATYESASFRSSVGGSDTSNYNIVGTGAVSGADAVSTTFSSESQTSSVQHYETDEQGNFKDANPQIVRRPAIEGPVTLTQNIRVRFLQPPPVPPPGPLIIKEVRPPQPPPPQPLRVRQQAPPLPQQPPLVLRERPPPAPAVVASQTVIRNLAAIAVPPRSVVIERLPPAPPKPRDIIIERWVPYGPQPERKTIVQRAEAAIVYPKPRNMIIQYEAPQVRVIRQFERLGVTPANPQEYIQRYGATLFDAHTLLQQARAAGVVEDISPPAASASAISGSSDFSSTERASIINYDNLNRGSIDIGRISSAGGAGRSSYYESSSYRSTGDVAGLGAGGRSSTIYESSYKTSTAGDVGDALFNAVDTNNDGVISQAEFRNAGL